MPKADEARVEAPEEVPGLLLELEPEAPFELVLEGRAPEPVLEPLARDMEPDEEAADDEVGAAEEDEGTMDLMPFEMVAVVLQFEVLGVE